MTKSYKNSFLVTKVTKKQVVHQKVINISRHDALMRQQQEDSRRMKALKKELKERKAKEHAERKIARETTVIVRVDTYTSIFQRILHYFRRLLL